MKTAYNSIVTTEHIATLKSVGNLNPIVTFGQTEKIAPASADKKKTLLLAIDIQNDFMEDIGSLGVKGSREDVKRLTQWMYNNIASITEVICSLDCHSMMQIFHPLWWRDKNGQQPHPYTTITYDEVAQGEWTAANGETERSLEYLYNLEKDNKKQLCIWPYHCLEGSFGGQLEREFSKMLYFHASARNTAPTLVYKGQNPYSEMYGIIKAEYDKENYINQTILDAISEYDLIYIAGEASSHCVLASLTQILEHFGDNKTITSNIILLEDCMSPIAGFEENTLQQFKELQEEYGIRIRKSTDPLNY